ncbi:MAG: DUF87 domain-containing protein [Planctomycetales bacterium]|nr:DUF87 domain-containing protein [Planctomycetales bacterium]
MNSARAVYEKLGAFYLGKSFDLASRKRQDDLVLYDSKDLVTHAVVVGMTGSGKTGLGIGLIEEAAIDGIPVIIVDPKGDMSNLLLNFPQLSPSDFEPWINADDAQREGMTAQEFAAGQAEMWRSGLAEWDQPPERIQALRDSAEFTIYTPGSDAGQPVSILSSFTVPPPAVLEDRDLLGDRVSTTVTSLLGLLGIDADPLRSREHILLTSIINDSWQKGQDLDLGAIIHAVQNPPFSQIGVMDLESFFPSKERFELSMTLNNLLAAPGFQSWMSGDPLDIDRILYTPAGKPRVSVFSISHLSDSERMFFVSLLLNQTLGWMRTRPGTSSLRAMLYIDEIFGYMPPVAEPPSKKPLLTMLKQARAFGIGLVLATQNPVDLDYKGLSNTGTWFIGRLQTERDKDRVLDGLEGATTESGGTFNRSEMSEILSNVGKRVFLLHNVHEDHPAVFQTRWALSYLAGPMTRTQIKQLMDDRRTEGSARQARRTKNVVGGQSVSSTRPVLSPDVTQVFLPPRSATSGLRMVYEPMLLGIAKVHFVDTRKGLSADDQIGFLAEIEDAAIGLDWAAAEEIDVDVTDLESHPIESIEFMEVPSQLGQSKNFTAWQKSLADHLYRTRRFELFKSSTLNEYSEPRETERDFRIRLTERAREERDIQIEKLRKKYASRLRTTEERIRRAEQKVEKEKQEASNAKMQTAISFGATVLSALFGRKIGSGTIGRATTAARGVGRASKQSEDVSRAEEDLMTYEERLDDLEAEINEQIDRISEHYDPLSEELDSILLKPRKTDINIRTLAVAWVPCTIDESGETVALI